MCRFWGIGLLLSNTRLRCTHTRGINTRADARKENAMGTTGPFTRVAIQPNSSARCRCEVRCWFSRVPSLSVSTLLRTPTILYGISSTLSVREHCWLSRHAATMQAPISTSITSICRQTAASISSCWTTTKSPTGFPRCSRHQDINHWRHIAVRHDSTCHARQCKTMTARGHRCSIPTPHRIVMPSLLIW